MIDDSLKCWCGENDLGSNECRCTILHPGKTYADRLIEEGSRTKIVRHATLEECVAVYVGSEAMLDPELYTIPAEASGDGREYTVAEFIEAIRRNHRCWGVARGLSLEVHVWIGEDATFSDVLCLFAHEFGHLEPVVPFESELRSEAFGRVAVRAWGALREVLGDTWIRSTHSPSSD